MSERTDLLDRIATLEARLSLATKQRDGVRRQRAELGREIKRLQNIVDSKNAALDTYHTAVELLKTQLQVASDMYDRVHGERDAAAKKLEIVLRYINRDIEGQIEEDPEWIEIGGGSL